MWVFKIIPFFVILMLSLQADEFNHQTLARMLSEFEAAKSGPFSEKCGQHEFRSQSKCPFTFKQYEKDKSNGWLNSVFSSAPGQSPAAACELAISSYKKGVFSNPQVLEKFYSDHSASKLGLTEDYFSSRMEQCYEADLYGNQEKIEKEKNTIIAMNYKYLKRSSLGTEQAFIELTNLNSLLGIDPLDQVPCDQMVTPGDAALCRQFEQQDCRPRGGLRQLAESLRTNAIEPLLALKMELKKTRGRGRGKKEKRDKINASIRLIESTFPILAGNHMEDFLEDEVYDKDSMPTQSNLMLALRQQFLNNREAIVEKIQKNNTVNRCLIYGDYNDDCDDFQENMQTNPNYDVSLFAPREENQRAREANPEQFLNHDLPLQSSASSYYHMVDCMDNFRDIKQGVNSLVLDTGINLALTVGTFGAGAVVGLGRAAIISARVVTLGADAVFLGAGVKSTIETCKESFNQLRGSSTHQSQNGRVTCPSDPESPEFMAVDDLRACITAAALTPIDALPFVPAVARRFSRPRVNPPSGGGSVSRSANAPNTRAVSSSPNVTLRVSAIDQRNYRNLVDDKIFKKCVGGSGVGKKNAVCTQFIESNRQRFRELAKACVNPTFGPANKALCLQAEKFMNANKVLRLSDLIPKEKQGKAVVVEFTGDRGHLVLRYMKEVVDESGNKVMKSFSQDGSSFLFPRRINEKWFQGRKAAHQMGDMDKYVPGSHYILDATPEQLETIMEVGRKGGLSQACTHDARRALDKAGLVTMPRGLTSVKSSVSIKDMAKQMTREFGPPDQNTVRAIQEVLDPKKAGFSDEQWKNFFVTEAGWAALSPLAIMGLYPAFVPLSTVAGTTAVDYSLVLMGKDGNVTYMTVEKMTELFGAYAGENDIDIPYER
tara:strand:+ start:85746 stop:88403 length:2658 start_codon:yes stop_codon:yes gene_type:complete